MNCKIKNSERSAWTKQTKQHNSKNKNQKFCIQGKITKNVRKLPEPNRPKNRNSKIKKHKFPMK